MKNLFNLLTIAFILLVVYSCEKDPEEIWLTDKTEYPEEFNVPSVTLSPTINPLYYEKVTNNNHYRVNFKFAVNTNPTFESGSEPQNTEIFIDYEFEGYFRIHYSDGSVSDREYLHGSGVNYNGVTNNQMGGESTNLYSIIAEGLASHWFSNDNIDYIRMNMIGEIKIYYENDGNQVILGEYEISEMVNFDEMFK